MCASETNLATSPLRRQLYQDLAPLHLSPLWEVLHALVPPQPNSPCRPALWKYDAIRPLLLRAGDAIAVMMTNEAA